MNESSEVVIVGDKMKHELGHLKKSWWWFLALGILLIICGIVALSYPFASSVSVVVVLGVALLIAGIAIVVSAFWTGSWSAFLVQLLIGILYIVVGLLTAEAPLEATGALTLLVAAVFIVAGIFRIVASLSLRFPQWGWVTLNGVLCLILGIMVYRQFPESSLWLIGTLFGIDMIFNGWSYIMLAMEVRQVPVPE